MTIICLFVFKEHFITEYKLLPEGINDPESGYKHCLDSRQCLYQIKGVSVVA